MSSRTRTTTWTSGATRSRCSTGWWRSPPIPCSVLGDPGEGIARELARPLGDELTRGQALRFGALLHDAGKPATRRVTDEGRVLFWGHDSVGADLARAFGRRMHASAALADFVAALAQHHLHLGFLVHEQAAVATARLPLHAQDRAGRGRGDRAVGRGPARDPRRAHARPGDRESPRRWRATSPARRSHGATGDRPRAPVRGDDLIAELGLEPGPEVGRLLDAIDEAAFAGRGAHA